jgi:hypothetical protein
LPFWPGKAPAGSLGSFPSSDIPPQSAFGAKHGQTLAASGVIRHRSKGKNIRRAEQPEGPLPNGCSAPRAPTPSQLRPMGKRLTGAVARVFASRGGRGFWAGAAGEHPAAVDGERGRCPGFYSLVGGPQPTRAKAAQPLVPERRIRDSNPCPRRKRSMSRCGASSSSSGRERGTAPRWLGATCRASSRSEASSETAASGQSASTRTLARPICSPMALAFAGEPLAPFWPSRSEPPSDEPRGWRPD